MPDLIRVNNRGYNILLGRTELDSPEQIHFKDEDCLESGLSLVAWFQMEKIKFTAWVFIGMYELVLIIFQLRYNRFGSLDL